MSQTTETVWQQFGDRLRAFIARRVDVTEDVEDILQDVFVKIHGSMDTLNDATRIEPWVFRIARNTVIDFYRSRPDRTAPHRALQDPPIPDPPADPMMAAIRPMIEDLPPKYRSALVLTEFEGLTQRQMAEREGISLSAAKSRVQRARQRVKELMLACCHFEFDRYGNIVDYQRRETECPYCSPGDSC